MRVVNLFSEKFNLFNVSKALTDKRDTYTRANYTAEGWNALITACNGLFSHYGVTPLLTLPSGNRLTLEALVERLDNEEYVSPEQAAAERLERERIENRERAARQKAERAARKQAKQRCDAPPKRTSQIK